MAITRTDWETVTFSAGQSTAFNIYDSEPQFATDSVKIAKYVVRSLGYPMTNVELAPEHIFTAFQSSIMKYSTIVNEAKIADNMLNVFGSDPTRDLTKAAIYENMGSTFKISQMYGQEAEIRNRLRTEVYSASIHLTAGVSEYDLANYIPQYTNSNVQLVEVYYYPIIYRSNAFDPIVNPGFNMASIMHEFGGVYSQNARLVIMPVFETLLKMQALELSQHIRRSHIGFELRKNKIVFMPAPRQDYPVAIQYILKSDKYENSIQDNAVNNVANFPINDYIAYGEINTPGKNWIQRFTLTLAKQILGIIRSKYTTVPYPQGQTSLDGETLRQEAVTEQDKLIQELRLMLQQSSMGRLVQKKREMAENIQIINSKVPSRIYIG